MRFLIVNPNAKRSKALATTYGDCLVEIDIEEFYAVINRKPYLMTPLKACKELEHFVIARIEGILPQLQER